MSASFCAAVAARAEDKSSPKIKLPRRIVLTSPPAQIPILSHDCDFDTFIEHWDRSRAVLLRCDPQQSCRVDGALTAALAAMRDHRSSFQDSFTAASTVESAQVSLHAILSDTALPSGSWYCSWITQAWQHELVTRVVATLPCSLPACLDHSAVMHEQALWWFVGRNASVCESLPGRPEHTDRVLAGTWHYQLCGAKEWTLRPTDELAAARFREQDPLGPARVLCREGDILLISTHEWWHATAIPPLGGGLSVSYAREFTMAEADECSAAAGTPVEATVDEASLVGEGEPAAFTNEDVGGRILERDEERIFDGLHAKADIAAGAVLLSEGEMAFADIEASDAPNCDVAEDATTGTMCVVALCDIAAGTMLSIA